MMKYPLTLHSIFERAEKFFPKKEIVSRGSHGIFRYTYAQYCRRTRQLGSVLAALGIKRGHRVGTFAWNNHRHLEAYFAIPCYGAVLHTINIRLSTDHIAYIINHAEDDLLLIDEDLVPIIEKVQDQLHTVKAYIIMSDNKDIPRTSLSPAYSYEDLLSEGNPGFQFPDDIGEDEPMGMCYTSATTGNPKGVVYTHRSTYLHTMALGLADSIGVSETDVCMPVVPMFHVNAWGFPFAGVWFGSKQVLPGRAPTPAILADLIEQERVTLTAGVPTVWLGLAKVLREGNHDVSCLRTVICGGSAAPQGLIREYESTFGIPFIHAYGMTESSPIITVSRLKSYQVTLSEEERMDIRAKQGLLIPGVEGRVVRYDGKEAAWDGLDAGELWLRGPWIADEYYKDERTEETFIDGWYHSGDVAVIDEEGTIKLVDRTKDLVKSGGEWISSLDLENALMTHPAVFEASVVGVPHPKWDERPIAFIVVKDEHKGKVTKEEFFTYLEDRFVKWWVPDDILFIDEIPKTSVGKFLKQSLRNQYHGYFISKA
ncbi:long-chain fatty acid--CoA ligase [Aneurinibacillus sp. Ricciae_BoGa-3]|uniref:long-chain fatty acid--CoA ligase n=1 Tax=Aneurinibacillus sp. Ricciae_BoGa-3 TaxID=3022697 RepID=UPI00233FBDA4|nr:long-chain fatty acid--CoA ligase [Aneurinibacillus sp. Ricciae_BoGa-3]WCK53173.1 long-chain fatty acid--CoA ligase [Aneurinibacillus sp. Ricciae_BoGa-3]